jgi:hypothetical protein
MDKAHMLFLHSSIEKANPDCAYGKTLSNFDFLANDKRVPHFLLVLRQLEEFLNGLEGLPEPEISEIISAALRVCGFAEPVEALQVIAIILEALDMQNQIPEKPPIFTYGGPPS